MRDSIASVWRGFGGRHGLQKLLAQMFSIEFCGNIFKRHFFGTTQNNQKSLGNSNGDAICQNLKQKLACHSDLMLSGLGCNSLQSQTCLLACSTTANSSASFCPMEEWCLGAICRAKALASRVSSIDFRDFRDLDWELRLLLRKISYHQMVHCPSDSTLSQAKKNPRHS